MQSTPFAGCGFERGYHGRPSFCWARPSIARPQVREALLGGVAYSLDLGISVDATVASYAFGVVTGT